MEQYSNVSDDCTPRDENKSEGYDLFFPSGERMLNRAIEKQIDDEPRHVSREERELEAGFADLFREFGTEDEPAPEPEVDEVLKELDDLDLSDIPDDPEPTACWVAPAPERVSWADQFHKRDREVKQRASDRRERADEERKAAKHHEAVERRKATDCERKRAERAAEKAARPAPAEVTPDQTQRLVVAAEDRKRAIMGASLSGKIKERAGDYAAWWIAMQCFMIRFSREPNITELAEERSRREGIRHSRHSARRPLEIIQKLIEEGVWTD